MRRPLAIVSLTSLFILLIYTFFMEQRILTNDDVLPWSNKSVILTGKVVNKEFKNDNQLVYLKDVSIDNQKLNNRGVICYLEQCEFPPSGAYIKVTGKTGEFNRARNEGEFDLKKYYISNGYAFPVYKCKITGQSQKYSLVSETLWQLKNRLSGVTDTVFSEEDAGIIKAMLFGDKSSTSADIKELYSASGISHILAISGLHISLIGMFVYGIIKRIGINRFINAIISISVMSLYVIMTGASTSSVRALIMFSVMVMSFTFLRTYDLITALSLSAAVIVISNVLICYSGSFYLSFLAVAGIAVFSKCISINVICDNRYKKILIKAANTVLGGFSVSYFTMPLILYYYYEYPTYSIIINLLVIPLMSLLVLTGFMAVIGGAFNIFIGKVISLPCHYILSIYKTLCSISLSLPFSHISFGKPELIQVILFYLICIFIVFMEYRIKRKNKLLMAKEALHRRNMGKGAGTVCYKKYTFKWYIKLLLLILGVVLIIRYNPPFKLAMLDVGQGDGIFIKAGNINIMIDGGSSSEKDIAKYKLVPFLKSQGVNRIDYWFVTHPDKDHTSGLLEILNEEYDIRVNTIVLPSVATINRDAEDIIRGATDKNINIIYVKRGDRIDNAEFDLKVVHPNGSEIYEDVNDYSTVLYMEYKGTRFLLTGDATERSENEYINYCRENGIDISDINVYKVAHHGSKTSSSKKLIDTINPDISIISSGINNKYGHPSEEVTKRLSKGYIYNTQSSGQISVIIWNKKCKIEEFIR